MISYAVMCFLVGVCNDVKCFDVCLFCFCNDLKCREVFVLGFCNDLRCFEMFRCVFEVL